MRLVDVAGFVDDLLVTNANVACLQGPAGPRPAEAADDVGLIEDGAVASKDGCITWVGPAAEWDGEATAVLDAGGGLVTPGYVDPHTHLVHAGDRAFELGMKIAGRSYMEILAAGGGIAHTTKVTRAASVEELVASTRPRLERMLAAGTVGLEAKSGYALELAGELRMLEAARRLADELDVPMAHTFLGAHAVPEEHETEAYVDLVIDMLPAVAKQGIATFCDVFVEKDVFSH